MTMISSMIVLLAAQAATVPATGAANSDAQVAVKTAAETRLDEKKADPVVCERVEEVGSLIRSKKVCMRKSQWEEQRRSDRSLVERAQVQRGITGN